MASGVFPAVLGFLVVPTAGAALSAAGIGLSKAEKMSTKLLIGSAAHALVAYGSHQQSNNFRLSSGVRDFAQGGAWGSGISSALCLAAAGFSMQKESRRTDMPVAANPNASLPGSSGVISWLSELRLPQA